MVVVSRPLRGSRLSSFYPPVPPEGPSLSDIDSPFQLQEYISLLIRQNPHDVETIVSIPGRVRSTDGEKDKDSQDDQDEHLVDKERDGRNDTVVDEACWIYEQLRRLAQDLTHPLITSLQLECTRTSCPEMKAGEWLYLCVAHGNDGAMEQCCAIDYIIHTLDSATALLNSPRAFPSRISIPQSSIRHFSSLARRLGRIFAHAYFHHREAFESAEAENSLYARFLALTARFDLVPPEFLVIPPRMTNPETFGTSAATDKEAEPPRLLGAALNPQPGPASPDKSGRPGSGFGQTGLESPRKMGRNRTDTMVFSEAEAYSEALRGQAGSPSKEPESRGSGLGFNIMNRGDRDSEIPHVDDLEIVSDSPSETCRPESELNPTEKEKSEAKPYTLTFSASGTMKTALPPGVSPSSSSVAGIGISPVGLTSGTLNTGMESAMNKTSPLEDNDFAERAPSSEIDGDENAEVEAEAGEGDEESALHDVLAQEEQEETESAGRSGEREREGDVSLIDLLARKQVLEMREKERELRLDTGEEEQDDQGTKENSSRAGDAGVSVEITSGSTSTEVETTESDASRVEEAEGGESTARKVPELPETEEERATEPKESDSEPDADLELRKDHADIKETSHE